MSDKEIPSSAQAFQQEDASSPARKAEPILVSRFGGGRVAVSCTMDKDVLKITET